MRLKPKIEKLDQLPTKWIQRSILSFGSTHVNKFPVLDFRHQTQRLKIQESGVSIAYKDMRCYFGKYREYLFLIQRDPFLSTVYRINTGLKEPQNMLKMSE